MLQVEGLSKEYDGREVVHGVQFEVTPGRAIGLVGNNGAGKTTTLKMLAGILEPTRGRATIEGHPTSDPHVRRRLGFLPEESPLYEDQTPLSYLAFFGSLYNVPRREVKARSLDLLARLQLAEDHWTRPIGQLSKGQRRKVAIARCVLHDPAVLILDEPTSGLDPATAGELDAFLRELRAQGKAILLSAHNLPQVEALCDEILIMHAGQIPVRGTLGELRARFGGSRYRVRASIAFNGSVPHGAIHEAWYGTLPEVETALEVVRTNHGHVLEVESVPPRLEEILRRVIEG